MLYVIGLVSKEKMLSIESGVWWRWTHFNWSTALAVN
jgi:hypothetical protein